MTGRVPVSDCPTSSSAIERITRMVSDHFSKTKCRYYLLTDEAQRPEQPIFD